MTVLAKRLIFNQGRVVEWIDSTLTDSHGSEFEPSSVYKYGFFVAMPSRSLELGAFLTS